MDPNFIQQILARIAQQRQQQPAGASSPALPPGAGRPGPGYVPSPEGGRVPPGLGGRPGWHPPIQPPTPWQPRQQQLEALWGQSQAGPVGTFGGGTPRPLPGISGMFGMAQPAQQNAYETQGIQADPSRHAQQAISGIMGKAHPVEDAAAQPAQPAQPAQGNWQNQVAQSYQQPQPQSEPAAEQPVQDNALTQDPRIARFGRGGRRTF